MAAAASPPSATKTEGRDAGDPEAAAVELGACAGVQLGVVVLVSAEAELVRVVPEFDGVVVVLVRVVEELARLVVELESVDVGTLLPRTAPNSKKYWADGSF